MPTRVTTDQKVGGSNPFERANVSAGQGLIVRDRQEPGALSWGLPVSQFLTVLSDLVDPGEGGLAPLQAVIARVDVGLLGERRACPDRTQAIPARCGKQPISSQL